MVAGRPAPLGAVPMCRLLGRGCLQPGHPTRLPGPGGRLTTPDLGRGSPQLGAGGGSSTVRTRLVSRSRCSRRPLCRPGCPLLTAGAFRSSALGVGLVWGFFFYVALVSHLTCSPGPRIRAPHLHTGLAEVPAEGTGDTHAAAGTHFFPGSRPSRLGPESLSPALPREQL